VFGFDPIIPASVKSDYPNVVKVTPSRFTETSVKIPEAGQLAPFSFVGRRYLKPIYDSNDEQILLCFARQSEKSTTIGNSCIAKSCLRQYYRILFVSPTQTQTETFSRDRLASPIMQSELLQQYKGKGIRFPDNVLYKKFITESDITLRYAFLSADRSRGVSAEMLVLDEIQDILVDVIPIVREACSHFPQKCFRYAGTPKTLENTMNVYWERYSTQNEWVIPCDGCKTWNVPDESNIGKKFLICMKCGKQIFPDHPNAQWASMRDEEWLRNPPLNTVYTGYRIPQIIVAWAKWADILDKMEGKGYTRAQFLNECLARAYDTAARLLTRSLLRANCDEGRKAADGVLFADRGAAYMGIDWSGGEEGQERSFTVVTIAAYVGSRFCVLYVHRFEGLDAEEEAMMSIIERLVEVYKVRLIGTDYGGGHVYNRRLINKFGLRRVYRYQYCGAKFIYYDKDLMRFMVNRTEAIMAVITAIRSGNVFSFFCWEDFQRFADDFLCVFQEQTKRGDVTVSKSPGAVDDALHSLVVAFLASLIEHPRPDIMRPTGLNDTTSDEKLEDLMDYTETSYDE